MAKKLNRFEFKGTGGTPRYPWDQWLDGSVWELKSGADYTVPTPTMVAMTHAAARCRGLRVRTARVDAGLVIKAIPREAK